jgi:hypothetical protein
MMQHLLTATLAAIALIDLWIVGGKTSATLAILFFAYSVAYRTIREQRMAESMIAISRTLGQVLSAIDAEPKKIEDR